MQTTQYATPALPLVSLLDLLQASLILFIPMVCIMRMLPDSSALVIENERDRAASQADESKQRASPLVVEPVIHLVGEEHDSGAPE